MKKAEFGLKSAKRWYDQVSFKQEKLGYHILLDGQAINTPQKQILQVQSETLAQVICKEWDAIKKAVDPDLLPLTRLLVTAQDRVPTQKKQMITQIIAYADGELCRFYAPNNPILLAEQQRLWGGLLKKIADKYRIHIPILYDIYLLSIADEDKMRIQAFLSALDDLQLLIFHEFCENSHSFAVAISLYDDSLPLDQALEICFLEENMQQQKWGIDPDIEQNIKRVKHDLALAKHCLSMTTLPN